MDNLIPVGQCNVGYIVDSNIIKGLGPNEKWLMLAVSAIGYHASDPFQAASFSPAISQHYRNIVIKCGNSCGKFHQNMSMHCAVAGVMWIHSDIPTLPDEYCSFLQR